MPQLVLTTKLISAIAQCFYGPGRPTGSAVDNYFRVLDVPAEVGYGASNKEKRVTELLWWVKNHSPHRAAEVLDLMVVDLFHGGHLNASLEDVYVGEQKAAWLVQQLAAQGHRIAATGELVAQEVMGAESLPATREQVRAQIDRLVRSREDAAALLGHTKDLLETVAKTVLVETGHPVDDKLDFSPLLTAAKNALPLMPASVDPASREETALRKFINGLWTMAQSVNDLRNAVGTGHGRLVSPSFDAAVARGVVDSSVSLARLWLNLLDERSQPEAG